MTDWKTQQMIKASGWPLAPELLAPGANFSAPAEGGLVPWHWACSEGVGPDLFIFRQRPVVVPAA
jgi:hypothetical protein